MKIILVLIAFMIVGTMAYLFTTESHKSINSKNDIKKATEKIKKKQFTKDDNKPTPQTQISRTVLEDDIPDDELVDIDTEYIPSQSTSEPISEEEMAQNEADILKALEENKDEGGESYEEEDTQEIDIAQQNTVINSVENINLLLPITEKELNEIEKDIVFTNDSIKNDEAIKDTLISEEDLSSNNETL